MNDDARPQSTWQERALEKARVCFGVVTLIARATRRCFFGVLAVVVILVFFSWPPQGKEILSLAVEGAEWTSFWSASLIVSAAVLALLVWYTSRVLMTFHDVVYLNLETPQLEAFRRRLERWFPRVLGALCILPLAFFVADVGVKTYVLNSPLLIIAAFALLALIDAFNGCIRCRLYRLGAASSLLFVLLSHRWATEVPYPEKATFGNVLPWLFKMEREAGELRLDTTGFQLLIAFAFWLVFDYACVRWSRVKRSGVLADRDQPNISIAWSAVAVAAMMAWGVTFKASFLPRTWIVVPAMLIVAVAIIAFIVHRRDWFPKMLVDPALTELSAEPTHRQAVGPVRIAPVTKRLLWAASILGVIVFALVWFWPIPTGQRLGTPALLLLALAIWVVFGGVVLTVVPKAYGLPALGLLPLIAAGCNALGDAPIMISRVDTPRTTAAHPRPTAAEAFSRWMSSPERPPDGPLYVVAAAGGGIRAAFLTASYLAAADDLSGGTFGKRVFVISGVSGGSLGAATYALVGNGSAYSPCDEGMRQPRPIGERQRAIQCTLDNDYLSPTVGTFLFPDLFRAFWVPAMLYRGEWQDRGRTLEQAWSASLDPARAKVFTNRFVDYPYSADELTTAPAKVNLILNATRVQSGHRVYASTFTWSALNALDLFDPLFDTADTSMVGAVHNSARFTYVSPAGAYFYTTANEFAGQVADGGYFDNSGVLSLLEVFAELDLDKPDQVGVRSRMRVIIITNDGSEKRICDASQPRGEGSEVQLMAPIVTFLATRPARAELSKAQLRRALARLVGRSEKDLCDGLTPREPLIEVSLNNDLVADFLRRQRDRIYTGECGESAVPLAEVKDADKRAARTEKEIAVRVQEAPLGWTLSAATTDWLTRYARLEACKLPRG